MPKVYNGHYGSRCNVSCYSNSDVLWMAIDSKSGLTSQSSVCGMVSVWHSDGTMDMDPKWGMGMDPIWGFSSNSSIVPCLWSTGMAMDPSRGFSSGSSSAIMASLSYSDPSGMTTDGKDGCSSCWSRCCIACLWNSDRSWMHTDSNLYDLQPSMKTIFFNGWWTRDSSTQAEKRTTQWLQHAW